MEAALRILIALFLLTGPATAEGIVSDAFGVVPAGAVSDSRSAWAGLVTGKETVLTQPEAVDAIQVFVGPKSLVAGRDDGHAVALVLDRHGNLVRDGIPVDLRLSEATYPTTTTGGIADVAFGPMQSSGTYVAGATVSDRQSARVLFRVTTDLATVSPSAEPASGRAEESVSIQTAEMSDQYGNVVEDGVFVKVTVAHNDGGATVAGGPTIGGRAKVELLSRGLETGGLMQVAVAANISDPASFGLISPKAVRDIPMLIWAIDELEGMGVRIGPMTTDSGHLLVDGAEVTARVASASGQMATASGWVRDGFFDGLIALDPDDGPYEITLVSPLGSQTRQAMPGETPNPIRGVE